jgi:NitT/TauT family transport system substrate-binding protein
MVEEKPDVVRRFVDATIKGWLSYLNDDPAPANALIKRDNPEAGDGLLAYGHRKLKERGIVDSGDAKTLGLGAMTDARWKDFFEVMVANGVYPKGMDYRRAFTTEFIGGKH